MADEGSGKIEAALDSQAGSGFKLLGNQLAENELLGEVLGADDDAVLAGGAAPDEKSRQNEECSKASRGCRRASHDCTDCASKIHRSFAPLGMTDEEWYQLGCNRFSNQPKPKSAASARSAAGMAPARITWSFTMASPRKINSPRPPAPIAAAIVASPTEITVATRTPAMMTPIANGSSTFRSNWRSVSPSPRPASTTAGSTLRIPV